MDLETIQSSWEKDSKIDDVMLDESSLRIPQLHHKYLTMHNHFSLLCKKAEQELKRMQHKKWLFYSGKEVPEDSEPFPYKVMKSDIQNWIGVDDDIMKVEMKIEYYKQTLYTLSDILKQIHQMTYHIKQCIEWRRFVNGV
jgi:hypothetical protein